MRAKQLILPSLVSFALLAGCDGAEDRKASYINQAQESLENKDYEKAKLGYKNAIQIAPKDIDARLGLAKTMAAAQDWRGAAGQYTGVLELDSEHREARLELGKLFLLARATNEAKEHADFLLSKDKEDLEALTLHAGVLAQSNDTEAALNTLKTVHEKAPENLDSAVLYSSLLSNSGRFDDAIAVINRTRKSVSENVDLLSILASIHMQQGNKEQALEQLNKIVELSPKVFAHKQKLAQYYFSIKDVEGASKVLSSAIVQFESNEQEQEAMQARQALVDLHVKAKEFETAQKHLDSYIRDYPESFDLQLGKARLLLGLGKKEEAEALLHSIVEQDKGGPSSVIANVELAKILFGNKSLKEANDLLNMILEDKPGTLNALKIRGQIAAIQERYDDAVNDFRVVLKSDPDDLSVQRALAETHYKAGEFRLSENYLKQLHRRLPQDFNVTTALADVSAKLGQIEQAIKLREHVLLYLPKESNNLIELAKLYAAQGNVDSLRSTALLLQNSDNGKVSGLFFEGMSYQSVGNHGVAVERFDEALALSPSAIEPMSAKTKSLLASNRAKEAIAWLSELVEEKSSLAANLLGESYLVDKSFDKAIDAFDKAISMSPEWLMPYRNKALAFRNEGKLNESISTLEHALEKNPTATAVRVQLAQLLEAKGNIDAAISQYEFIYENTGKTPVAANNLAMLLVTYHPDDPQALARAAQVAESLRGMQNPAFMDTLGWIYAKQGQLELALPLMEEAARQAPQVAQINYHLAYLYNEKQNALKAKEYLEKALTSQGSFVGRANAEALLEKLNSKG